MIRLFSILILSLISISCNDYQKLLNSTENEVDKYTAAEEYYDNGEFRRANALFEQIMPSYSGKPQGERLIFFFANTYFETKSYYLAAIQFENFIKSYPNSQRIVDAYFMEGKSYFMLSPAYSLDQDDTNTAIEKLQVFVNRYPNSEYVSEAIELIEQLQNKLRKKILKSLSNIILLETIILQLNLWIILWQITQELSFGKRLYITDGYLHMKLL